MLLPFAGAIPEADASLGSLLAPDTLAGILAAVPDAWLDGEGEGGFHDPDRARSAYAGFFSSRLEEPRGWAEDLEEAHRAAV